MKLILLTAAVVTAATLLAGCTVNTPPIEVRGPDEIGLDTQGRTVTLDAAECNGAPEKEFAVAVPQNVNNIRVDVEAEARNEAPAVVLVVVKDKDTGDELAKERVEVENQTTATLNVNVEGKDNVVVVTQAIQGSAAVNVAAHGAEANQAVADDSTVLIGDENQVEQDTDTNVTLAEDEPTFEERPSYRDDDRDRGDRRNGGADEDGRFRYRESYRDDEGDRYRIDLRG